MSDRSSISSGSYSDSGDQNAGGNVGLIDKKPGRSFDSVLGVLLLNCSMAGIQFTFAIMSTVLTPYNDFLNMSDTEKTAIAVIGPICGFVIQPIFGSWSDGCHFKYGRRRIFILGGVLFILASLAFIGYGYVDWNRTVAEALAITGMIVMNVSINVMLCPARAIVSDLVSPDAQNKGQIYAALMMGASFCLCNFIVYGLSYLITDLNYLEYNECFRPDGVLIAGYPWSRATLTLVICSIGIVFIVLVQIPTMIYGKEQPLAKSTEKKKQDFIFVRMGKQIKHMPRIIMRVCLVFFGSWAGYYPFQMFCSDIYGLQLGSLANAIGSIVTFVFSIFLDGIVRKIGERKMYKISQGIGAIAMIAMIGPFLYVNDAPETPAPVPVLGNYLADRPDYCDNDAPPTVWWIQLVVCVLVGLVGLNNAVMNSIPFGIVGKCGGEAKGLYMGILNCCCVLAQALSILIDVIWTAIFPQPRPYDPNDPNSVPLTDDEFAYRSMLSKLGHVVVCAVFSVVAFGLTFILRNPSEEEAEKKKLEEEKGEGRDGDASQLGDEAQVQERESHHATTSD